MDEGRFSISAPVLYQQLGTAAASRVIDVRRAASFDSDDRMLVAAIRRDPVDVARWGAQLSTDKPVLVYCAHGQEVSQQTAVALRGIGLDARYLESGIAGWAERGLPLRKKVAAGEHGWVTRERPKIDRIACPWLIRRFIDPEANFLYVATEQVFDVARVTGAVAYDIPALALNGSYCARVRARGDRDTTQQEVYGDFTYLDDGTGAAFQFTGYPAGGACTPSCNSGYLGADDYVLPVRGTLTRLTPLVTWRPLAVCS